ncbi:MAG: hypothetical protein IKP31_00510 [Lachnospiraceae bacterium]|nr:hypothetical protein [Lachnospiraceae bacterium]
MKQKTGARVDKALDEAVDALKQKVQSSGEDAAEDVYSVMLIGLKEQEGSSVDTLNTGKKSAYYRQYIDRINAMYGTGGKALAETLERYLPSAEGGKYIISTDPEPEFILDYDESNCEIRQCFIRDVVISYVVGDTVIEEKTCTCDIPAPDVSFSDESINFYDYSLVGMKGIYITGQTSSFVGSVFAGTHEFEENREAELAFGEKDPYGGINMLTTQAAMFGNSIVTTGDINLKGAFVLFGNQDNEISIYANTINDIENYPSKTEYTVNGSLFLRDGSVEFTDAEHYENIVKLISSTADLVDDITSGYSSANDSKYTGRYSKIITNEDVTLTDDFTGVIITAGNVIIENGCNVEGLVIAGDRIYIYGNNNIVSGREIVRTIVNEEKNGTASSGTDGINNRVSDYIEAMPDKGVIIAP